MAKPILPLLLAGGSKLAEAYFKLVIKQDGCWSWSGRLTADGYPKMRGANTACKHLMGHRVSYAIHYGVDPGNMFVCHRCDNPTCTNPAHLFLGTVKDNSDDMMKKGRHRTIPRPEEKNPMAVLRRDEVRYILLASNLNMANTELGRLFGVTHSQISCIKLGKSWPNVTIDQE